MENLVVGRTVVLSIAGKHARVNDKLLLKNMALDYLIRG